MTRMSAAEMLLQHKPLIGATGATVRVVFADWDSAIAFQDALLLEASEIPRSATRLVRTISFQEGPQSYRPILELVDGDMRTHRFVISAEDLMSALATIQVGTIVPGLAQEAEPAAAGQDDLLELAHIHTRLDRAEAAIRLQRRRTNALEATFVERSVHPNGRFPTYCCQRCGDPIGYIGRAFQAVGLPLHTCRVEREDA